MTTGYALDEQVSPMFDDPDPWSPALDAHADHVAGAS